MKNNKKVAILYSGGKNFGGVERYILDLLTHAKDGFLEINVLSLGEWELTDKLKKSGHNPVFFSSRRINPITIRKIGKYLTENKFDLLVSQGVVSNAYARLISLIYKVPNLVTVHSSLSDDYSNSVARLIYSTIDHLSRFSTKKYIAVSKFLKLQMVKSGIDSKKITVIYNGAEFKEPPIRQRRRLVIGAVGRLHSVKGFDILIRAFAMMENRRLRLKIAGGGDELNNLKALAKELGVESRIEFVGFTQDVTKFLDSIDVYVQPSRSEGFGLAVIEAMSRNLPVVVTPVGSLGEIISNGENGLIAESLEPRAVTEALSFMVQNYDKSKRMGENARVSAMGRFDMDRWLEETIKAYRDAM